MDKRHRKSFGGAVKQSLFAAEEREDRIDGMDDPLQTIDFGAIPTRMDEVAPHLSRACLRRHGAYGGASAEDHRPWPRTLSADPALRGVHHVPADVARGGRREASSSRFREARVSESGYTGRKPGKLA